MTLQKSQTHSIFVPGKNPTRGKIMDQLSKQFPLYYQCDIDQESLFSEQSRVLCEFDGVEGVRITFNYTVSAAPVQRVSINDRIRPQEKAVHKKTRPSIVEGN